MGSRQLSLSTAGQLAVKGVADAVDTSLVVRAARITHARLALAYGLAIAVAGLALAGCGGESRSAAHQAGYDAAMRLDDGLSSVSEILGACDGTGEVYAQQQGYTDAANREANEFSDGCREAAEQIEAGRASGHGGSESAAPTSANAETASEPGGTRSWPELAGRWAEVMASTGRSLDEAARVRDRAAINSGLETLSNCSSLAPPDPGGVTLGDAVTPELPAGSEHLAFVTVYGFIETACRNYQQAAEHLTIGFDSTASSSEVEIGIGLQLLSSGNNFTRLVASELERNWELTVPAVVAAPSDSGQTEPGSTAEPATPHAGQAQQVVAVDGTPVPAQFVEAYERGKAVGAEIRATIYAGLSGTYAEGFNGPQRYFEDVRGARSPYLARSDNPEYRWYQVGAWEQSGLYDGPGKVVYEGG